MLATLVVIANIFSAPLPTVPPVLAPAPTVVMDGCNTATAKRVAELRRAIANKQEVRGLLREVVAHDDGMVCLMESTVLVELHVSRVEVDVVQRVLIDALRSRTNIVARRARALVMQLRERDPSGYDALMRRAAHTTTDDMPSPREPGAQTNA